MSCVSSIAKIERLGKLTAWPRSSHFFLIVTQESIIFIVRSSGRGPGRRLAYLLDVPRNKAMLCEYAHGPPSLNIFNPNRMWPAVCYI